MVKVPQRLSSDVVAAWVVAQIPQRLPSAGIACVVIVAKDVPPSFVSYRNDTMLLPNM